MGFGYIPANTTVSVKVESLRLLRDNASSLVNPVITTGTGTLTVIGTVQTGNYLKYDGGSTATVYDLNWNAVTTLPVTKQSFVMPNGTAPVSVTVDGSAPKPWLEVQFITKGDLITILKTNPVPTSWNVADDFVENSNPNGQWEYGKLTTSGFGVFPSCGGWYDGYHTGGTIWVWYDYYVFPSVGHIHSLNSGWDHVMAFGRAPLYPNQLILSPGDATSGKNSAAVRWKAPLAGYYTISARFDGIDSLTVGTRVYSGSGGLNWSASMSAKGQYTATTQTVSLAAGEYVYFEVTDGGNSNMYDCTALTATVVPTHSYSTIADLKEPEDGVSVRLTDAKVATCATGTFTGGALYIEELNRTCGIKIVPRAGLQAIGRGNRVTVTGVMATDANGERYLDVTSIDSRISGAQLNSLGLVNRSFASNSKPGKDGVLVTVWGRVTYDDPAGKFVYVDDGGGVSDGNAAGRIGVRVVLGDSGITKVINATNYVSVRGVIGLVKDGTAALSVVRPRDNADISVW